MHERESLRSGKSDRTQKSAKSNFMNKERTVEMDNSDTAEFKELEERAPVEETEQTTTLNLTLSIETSEKPGNEPTDEGAEE